MSMEMSARDKKLLVYLVAVVILALAYFFGTKPFLDKKDAMQSQVDELQREVNELTEIYNNQETYVARIAEEKVKFENALEKFPGGMTQENTLMMLQGIEDRTNTWLSRITFSEVQYLTVGAGAGSEAEAAEGEEASEGENADGGNISASSISTLRQDLSLDYSCTYNDFKGFIDFIENYDSRLFISSINARYAVDSNTVMGSVTLSQFAVDGAGKKLERPELSVSTGVNNIFTTLSGSTGSSTGSGSNVLQLGEVSDENGEEGSEGNAESEEGTEGSESEDGGGARE